MMEEEIEVDSVCTLALAQSVVSRRFPRTSSFSLLTLPSHDSPV